MKIAIIGAGAVGGWYGGHLMQAGHEVVFVVRGETLERLSTHGLMLNGRTIAPVAAVDTARQLTDIEAVILCVKVTPEIDLGQLLDLPPGVPVALTQNSVEVPELVAATLGADRVWPGVVRGYFHHTGPAQVEFHEGPVTFHFGTFDGRREENVGKLAAALPEAGIAATVVNDARAEVWEKATQVAPTGALGLLAGANLGQLRTTYRESLTDFMTEVAAVAGVLGIDNPGMVERTMVLCD